MQRCGIFPFAGRDATEYPLLNVTCHYTVADVNVHAHFTQTYKSTATVAQDVVYVFPLPSNAAVCAFYAVIDGKNTMHGIVKERDEAKREYKCAVAAGKTAGLLDQHSPEVFQVSLGNLKPGQAVEVNISFVSVIAHDGTVDSLRLTLPLSIAPYYGTPPTTLETLGTVVAKPLELSMSFQMTSNITSIVSHTHPIALTLGTLSEHDSTEFDPKAAHVKLATTGLLNNDVVVVVQSAHLDHPRCVVERLPSLGQSEETTDALALTLVPRFQLPLVPSQEYIFLIDRSGSMSGQRIAAVRAALQIMLRSLPSKNTTFNLCSFGSHADTLWPSSMEYSAETVRVASAYVDAIGADYGGTEINLALTLAIDRRSDRQAPTAMFVLTDGEAWDLDRTFKTIADEVEASQQVLRVFVLGVGNDVSTAMCDGIARAGNGVTAYVAEHEKPDAKLVSLLKAARGGLIQNLSVDWGVLQGSTEEDFEVVEAPALTPEVPGTGPAISLFESGSSATAAPEVPLGPEDIPVVLPPVSRLQQAPARLDKLPPLYPGFRCNLFAIVRRDSDREPLPTKVVVSGMVRGIRVSLEVPVTAAVPVRSTGGTGTNAVQFVHVLAARALVQAFEDQPKTPFVKAHIVRLSTTYGIASSQTSFVAVADDDGELFFIGQSTEMDAKLVDSVAVDECYAQVQFRSVSGLGIGGAKRHRKILGDVDDFDEDDEDDDDDAKSASTINSPYPHSAQLMHPGVHMDLDLDYGFDGEVDDFMGFALFDDDGRGGGGGGGLSLDSLSSAPVPVASAAPAASAMPVAAPAPSKQAAPPTPSVELLAREQQFDGSFSSSINPILALTAPPALPAALAALRGTDALKMTVWTTVLALAYLRTHFASPEETAAWALLADKARDFIGTALVEELGVPGGAEEGLLEGWINDAATLF